MNQIYTLLTAMLPVAELRGSIPLALTVYNLSPIQAYIWSIIGNMLPIFFLLWFWGTLAQWLIKKSPFANKFFTWLFERTRRRAHKKFEKYGHLALIIFVAIPLPITGAWTGSMAAFLFGVPYWKAVLYIFCGVLIAGIVVTLASLGVITISN
ncbi:small multi-drug export protein [Patescibacteria group bacterium]|nr:small multi-drug export protein [Patescibacteria group bacterium]MBU4512628.1 small multi-drug export protein [Patescibacteria group bacterium]MCG2693534.1 small multi-drug export protein [Candidatus Parcubacteria bacterium]